MPRNRARSANAATSWPESYHSGILDGLVLAAQHLHNRTSERQRRCPLEAPDHGREVVVVTNGRLDFALSEQIFYGEFSCNPKKRALG